jgi:hypothetical protein
MPAPSKARRAPAQSRSAPPRLFPRPEGDATDRNVAADVAARGAGFYCLLLLVLRGPAELPDGDLDAAARYLAAVMAYAERRSR